MWQLWELASGSSAGGLNTFEICYSLRPLENGAIFSGPIPGWTVWLEQAEGKYEMIAEEAQKPSGEDLERIFAQATYSADKQRATAKQGPLASLQRFLRTLSQ